MWCGAWWRYRSYDVANKSKTHQKQRATFSSSFLCCTREVGEPGNRPIASPRCIKRIPVVLRRRREGGLVYAAHECCSREELKRVCVCVCACIASAAHQLRVRVNENKEERRRRRRSLVFSFCFIYGSFAQREMGSIMRRLPHATSWCKRPMTLTILCDFPTFFSLSFSVPRLSYYSMHTMHCA